MPNPPSEQTPFMGGRTDKGRANRFRLDVPVQLRERGGALYTGLAKNIGPGGLFVATVRALGVGERVTVTFKMKGDEGPSEALAEVRCVGHSSSSTICRPASGCGSSIRPCAPRSS